jgi:6-pyruvoyltetrahydropterin/6-carboxytetrahydropterin synthase
VEVEGELGGQGYVLDFAIVKQVARRVCERLDEKVLIPAHSNCLRVREESGQVIVFYENDEFRFPRADVVFVPIVHTSAEELAQYLLGEIRRELQVDGIDHIHAIQIGVEETPGQAAYCREEA